MSKDYPLHPGQTHAEPLYATIPLEEYERLMAENKRITDFAIGTIEREKRIMNAYIALMGVLLALLLGILCYTGYVAYTAPERDETMTMRAE